MSETGGPYPAVTDSAFQPEVIRDHMRRVAGYQVDLQNANRATTTEDINYEWIRGVFYTGMTAAWQATGDQWYLDATLEYCKRRNWKLDTYDTRHADWQCIGQVYADLYMQDPKPERLADIQHHVNQQMATPRAGREDWWWCDALYMAPPMLTRLYTATEDTKYLQFLDTMYWDAYEFLYDPVEQLFFRDKNYFQSRSANGQKVFWSRGNGWVVGGLARLIPHLPQNWPTRPRYEALFTEMMGRLLKLQQPDGYWRTSLLDPKEFTMPETSGTGFFCYATAWGVNNGYLEASTRENMHLAWNALLRSTTPEGKVGDVQVVAAAPGPAHPSDTREYAAGALLLAGAELTRAV